MRRGRALAFSGFAGNTVWVVGDAFMMGVIARDATVEITGKSGVRSMRFAE